MSQAGQGRREGGASNISPKKVETMNILSSYTLILPQIIREN